MASLQHNLVKRIERLPKPTNAGAALQPLFEAIMNAIHATQERFGDSVAGLGRVDVNVAINRKKSNVTVTVEDNGLGLNEKNWDAFTTTDTDNKIKIGGKGVGRLMWLDCFERISIQSTYADGEQRMIKSFDFVLDVENQIRNLQHSQSTDGDTGSFSVSFRGLRDNGYFDKFPGRGEFVFQHLMSHFLPTFIGGRCPVVIVRVGDETRKYPEDIFNIVYRTETPPKLKSKEYGELTLTLMECDKIASSDMKGDHFIHFIAHDRTVHSQSIDSKLGFKYFGEDEKRVFHAILTGKYLDEHVNQERTAFTFPDSELQEIINSQCMPHVEVFLAEPIAALKKIRVQTIDDIVSTYPSVRFGEIEELQKKVPMGETAPDAIYGHLARERFRRDVRQAEKIRDVMLRLKDDKVTVDTFRSTIKEASQHMEEAEQRSLAEYIVRRKGVLDLLEILLEKVKDESHTVNYQREDVLHSFICPVRVNNIPGAGRKLEASSSHDLWIIDERLTFAEYFSSDMEFHKLSSLAEGDERPDVLIFDQVHGLRQKGDTSKVMLVEFKRPGRKDYDYDENPQQQVEGYVRKLLTNTLDDVRGRPIKLDNKTVFYCYIVADIVGKLDAWTFSWQRTADGRGRIYTPRDGFNGYIELIGWDALLADAKARNAAFFDSAGISGKSFFTTD
ncbi:ATP-binding protein [Sinorhizobium medicae]|uniref:ATP-binding protein n=1 Tax=Sinorhizobium medicae TaxID=110321 RepID=UPI00040B2CDE|nr:ATP-binding protein [Sinorhizobium medicae]